MEPGTEDRAGAARPRTATACASGPPGRAARGRSGRRSARADPLQHLLEQDELVLAVAVPAHPDDIVAVVQRQEQHGPLLVVALEADRLVVVLLSPAVQRV